MCFDSAALCITDAVLRFVYVGMIKTFCGICLNLYLILFAAILVCFELSVLRFRSWFYFLNFGWGKALFHFFIATLVLGSGITVHWFDIFTGVSFILQGIACLIISFSFRATEKLDVDRKLAEIEEIK